MQRQDVIVVGGGIIGCSIAWHLAKRGMKVTVVEKGRAGGQASGAAAGMLAPLSEAHGPGAFLDLGMAGLRLFPELAATLHQETGIDVEYVPSGLVRVALDEEEAQEVEERYRWQREAGLTVEWLDGAAVRELENGLSAQVVAAAFYPQEHHVFSPYLVKALALAAARRGVTILEGTQVTGLIREGDRVTGVTLLGGGPPSGRLEAEEVVLATGAWTGLWSGEAGVDLPVRPIRGQIIALEQAPPPFWHIVYAGRGYAVPKVRGTVVIGATEDHAGFDNRVTAAGLSYLSALGPDLVPALEGAYFHHAWAGLRPWSADGLPIIGRVPGRRGLTVAAGHYRNGILLSAVTGRLVARLLTGGDPAGERFPLTLPATVVEAVSPRRLSGGSLPSAAAGLH